MLTFEPGSERARLAQRWFIPCMLVGMLLGLAIGRATGDAGDVALGMGLGMGAGSLVGGAIVLVKRRALKSPSK